MNDGFMSSRGIRKKLVTTRTKTGALPEQAQERMLLPPLILLPISSTLLLTLFFE